MYTRYDTRLEQKVCKGVEKQGYLVDRRLESERERVLEYHKGKGKKKEKIREKVKEKEKLIYKQYNRMNSQ